MSEILYAIILGLVQGIAEFLPISSSAHLIIVSEKLVGTVVPLSLNIALHLGTLLAVLIYFHKDIIKLIKAFYLRISKGTKSIESDVLVPAIIIGTIPAGVIGLLFKDVIEEVFHKSYMTAIPLIIVGPLMWLADRNFSSKKSYSDISIVNGLIIGLFQACALIPGVSRSGATLIGGRLLGIDRVSAAKFSFILGIPAMLGAFILESKNIFSNLSEPVFYVGFISSFIFGILAIEFLLRFLRKFGLGAFCIYRIILGIWILMSL